MQGRIAKYSYNHELTLLKNFLKICEVLMIILSAQADNNTAFCGTDI